MKKYAFIRGGTVREIVEYNTRPGWPPTQEGEQPLFVEVPKGVEVEAGFLYDAEIDEFTPYEGYIPPDERSEPEDPPEPPDPVQQQIDQLKEMMLAQLEATTDIYESFVLKGADHD